MKTLTRILLLCLFPVLATTGCEKKVNITYEHRYWDEYKFINASSKEVYCLYGSSHIVNNREKRNVTALSFLKVLPILCFYLLMMAKVLFY